MVVYHYAVVPVIYLAITLIAFSVFLGLVRLQSSRYISASLMNISRLLMLLSQSCGAGIQTFSLCSNRALRVLRRDVGFLVSVSGFI